LRIDKANLAGASIVTGVRGRPPRLPASLVVRPAK
jgi:hypothetical protein